MNEVASYLPYVLVAQNLVIIWLLVRIARNSEEWR